MNFIEKFSILHADSIYSPSASMRDIISRDYRVLAEKIAVVPNPINLSSYKIPAVSTSGNAGINILYTGRIEKRKGVDILIKAMPQVIREVKNARFTFVGSDTNSGVDRRSLKDELVQFLRANGCENSFEFIDRVEKEALIKMYQQSDIFVIPSLYECFGYTCLEAMACGRPVIGSNVGGISEIIRNDKNGILFPVGDSEALARDIIRLSKDKALRIKLGLEARKDVEASYSGEVVSRQTVEYYNEVIGLKKSVGK